jgi:3-deoxy-7-phosphoheptulonate synthase
VFTSSDFFTGKHAFSSLIKMPVNHLNALVIGPHEMNANVASTSTNNLHIAAFHAMPTPHTVQAKLPLTEAATRTVENGRDELIRILKGEDKRRFVVVGPCSIHDPIAGMDYARRLKALAAEVSDVLMLVMRVYFEKPRTTVGWKGYINDPHMDDTFRIDEGMVLARQFLLDVNELGLPAGTEALDPISPQYLGDLIAWNAIGARTTESQTHREMSSGLSTPVGFKNATNGEVGVAVNAILSASRPHRFLGISSDGKVSIVHTTGNPYGHLVLRGGDGRPNYDTVSIALAEEGLKKAKLTPNIVVDCSHANSYKKPELQPLVMADVVSQIVAGNRSVVGVMIESNIAAGNQSIQADRSKMTYGCSVTDGCVDWETTASMIRDAAQRLRGVLV